MVENRTLRSRGDKVFDAFNVLLMIVLAILFVYPFWHCLALSLGDDVYSRQMGIRLLPIGHFSTANYYVVLRNKSLLLGYRNTLIRTISGTVISVLATYLSATALARRNLKGKKLISWIFMLTLFLNAGLIPTFLAINSLKLTQTMWSLILPGAVSAYNVMIARNFIATLPRDLEESALIDGARPIRITFQIMLPLSTPILSVLTLWSAVGHWNAWFDAMIYNNQNPDLMVISNVLRSMIAVEVYGSIDKLNELAEATQEAVKAAAIIFGTIPILCLYPVLQGGLTKGILIGAVKG